MAQSKEGIISIHGKEYYTVARRVGDFRKTHKAKDGWAIITQLVEYNDTFVIASARVIDPEGRTVAIGHAEEFRAGSRINRTSAVENAETSAIGRCLAGFGMSGSGEYASANEIEKAKRREKSLQQDKAPGFYKTAIDTIVSLGGTEEDFHKTVLAAKPDGTHPRDMGRKQFDKAAAWYIAKLTK